MILVDDVVARSHVKEGAETSAGDEAPLARCGTQQGALADHGELEIGGHKALAQRSRNEVQAGPRLATPRQLLRRDDLRRQVAQPIGGALRLALVAEHHEHAVVVTHEAQQVALGAGEVASCELRPGSDELHGLVALHQIQLQRAGEQGADLGERHVEPLTQAQALHRQLHLAGEVGERPVRLIRVEYGDPSAPARDQFGSRREAPGQGRQGAHSGAPVKFVGRLLAAVPLPRGDGLMQPRLVLLQPGVGFESRPHRRLVQSAGGALGVDGEGAHRVDLIAPELHAQRIPKRRVHVHEPAAHGELAAGTHSLDALVAQGGEAGHGGVERERGAGRQGQRPRL